MFKHDREVVENLAHPRRLAPSVNEKHIQEIKDLMLENRRLAIKDIAEIIGISNYSVHTILKDHSDMKRVASRLLPKTFNFLEK